ncbi:type I-MYXAN CRISPR-associated protein Cas6/Cmx6 [Thiorhodococcus mannitoliphagus]|uniref:Type I-MYXAN CRISPR-associated protein Cas6/Cmx6 n=1 Tax=Thiorhodococcus mannitoliphagus TaxID=329406 RepID=A0A6P1DSY5_9GAMM|nr:type I-MYXAN CRISPR-associated protein Cas6/Cmx6 [Thiorhodococcus mannitoliphagus]NEX20580.1 type I-MYXAN CRISPR-associated protein Cas6/Cmx6 [Thiorhodococcus mannitoliphagus]
MFWNEDDTTEDTGSQEDVVDILFAIDCKRIPVDHAYLLSNALQSVMPWIAQEPLAGIHSIHVAGSQNGWERPEHGPESLLMVSRRTKLTIRVPRTHADALLASLPGTQLEIAGNPITLGVGKTRTLSTETTIFARYVATGGTPEEIPEAAFLETAAQTLAKMNIKIRKALCGKSLTLQGPDGPIHTRSLMLSGLTKDESIRLQQLGLGPHRLMGCGIFIPHKGIDPVKKDA